MQKPNLYFVGIFLADRIFFNPLGFTSFVYYYCPANDFKEATNAVKSFCEAKYRSKVTGTRAQTVSLTDFKKYGCKDLLIVPPEPARQQAKINFE